MIELEDNRCNFQQRIPFRIKAGRFNVYNYGKKPSKPVGYFC